MVADTYFYVYLLFPYLMRIFKTDKILKHFFIIKISLLITYKIYFLSLYQNPFQSLHIIIIYNPQMQNPHIESISVSSLVVEIRYLQAFFEPNYVCKGYSLKQFLQQHVSIHLHDKIISVKYEKPQQMIMKDVRTIRSTQISNYRFNPFCDCVQIYVIKQDASKFTRDFRVSGDIRKLRFQYVPLNLLQWNQCPNHLTPQTPISDFLSYICRQTQLTYEHQLSLIKAFSYESSTVQNIMNWDRQHFASLHIKPNIIDMIQQAVQEIRQRGLLRNSRVSDEEKQCVKVSNSHKILRYLVEKVRGREQLGNIPWVNLYNLKKAFDLVRKNIVNQPLLKQLEEYFCQFALNIQQPKLSYSRGIILYGPPGTGKTSICEILPKMIGIHPISHGLSAADFMKSLVGQTSRMIRDLGNRAELSPHLLCFLSIDDFDLVVPDRKINQKSNEALSALLSMIGGNRDVPNLILTASTNYLQRIDLGISRRIRDHFKVNVPTQFERAEILFQSLKPYFGNRQLQHIASLTQNFSGAALKHLAGKLVAKIMHKERNLQVAEVNLNEIEQTVKTVAQRFEL